METVRELAFELRVVVDTRDISGRAHELQHVRAFERPLTSNGKHRSFHHKVAALRRSPVRLEPHDVHCRYVDDAGDLLGHNREEVLRLDTSRDERRDAAQRTQLVVGQT